jgi:hypothetical protein
MTSKTEYVMEELSRLLSQRPYRYDLAGATPRIILITDLEGKRSDVPRLSYVVLPQR